MEEDYFTTLEQFIDRHEPLTALHYSNLTKAVKYNMMYDVENVKLIPRRVFDKMVKNDEVGQYITNENHPVIYDAEEYQNNIAPKIINYREEIDILASTLNEIIDTDPTLFREFAQKLYWIEPEYLQSLRLHPGMQKIMGKRLIWEELYRFHYQVEKIKSKLPSALNIDRMFIHQMLQSPQNLYIESVEDNFDEIVMEGLVILISEEQEFLSGQEVILKRGQDEIIYEIELYSEGTRLIKK